MRPVSPTVAMLRSAGVVVYLVASVAGMPGTASRSAIPHQPTVPTLEGNMGAPASAKRVFEAQLDSLVAAIDTLAQSVRAGPTAAAQRAYRQARTAYKCVEGLIAYFAPGAVTALQGPLEAEGGDEFQPRPYNTPGAFPAIEASLFPELVDSTKKAVLAHIRVIREQVTVLRSMTGTLTLDESAVFEAARVEIARVSTLDIAGFDSDRQDDALLDAAAALDGVRATLVASLEQEDGASAAAGRLADSTLREAADYLRRHKSFDGMDRFTFVARYSLPASHAVAVLRATQPKAHVPIIPLWRDEAASVYDSGAFDAVAYAVRHAYVPITGERIVALGARLFADPRLSGPGTRSCAGCHFPTRAFTDGQPKRAPLMPEVPGPPGAPPARHTPTLLNAALQPTLFADARARGLEQQIAVVLNNPDEMRSSIDTAVRRVSADSGYRVAFGAAFGKAPDVAVTGMSLRIALAAYVRSLTALNSPFDRALRGDSAAVNDDARRGFTVFMGKARCGTCHFAPLFNGTQPPSYLSTDPEIIGVPDRPVLQHAGIDPDPGRAGIDGVDAHRFAFKVPTVRNAALTGPYMHNGAFPSLDDVVAFYDAGGGVGIGIELPYQTLFDQPLKLTPGERTDLIAFLRSLTDTIGTIPPSGSVAIR